MKALSPIRLLRVPRRGSHLSAWPSHYSLLSASSTTFFILLFRRNQLCTPALRCCTLALDRGQPRRSFPSLNFHKACVRRKPGGHVPNGLIERAQSTVPAFTYSRKRASD
jgi:hypothetical protein